MDNTDTPTLDSAALNAPIDAALEVADLRVLAACLFHMTGDKSWLEPPFQPMRDVRLIADPTAGFDPDTQATLRNAASRWLHTAVLRGDLTPTVTDPGPDRFAHMLSVFLGEVVPDEYLPMVREDFGFDQATSEWANPTKPKDLPSVLVVGAGVSGLGVAAQLIRLGFPVEIVDKHADVGGTWFANRYPGCGVDTPNHFYSFSAFPNPRWRRFFSPRDELFDYVGRFCDEHGLREAITCDTKVTTARWDDVATKWTVDLVGPQGTRASRTVDVVVFATGHFDQPVTATFPGQETFTGTICHTAAWPAQLDLAGQSVAVVGTGASAMQLVPTIAGDVAALTVFQRTPQWVRPVAEYNMPVDPRSQWLFENVPLYGRWYRFAQFWRYGDGLLRFLKRDPEWTEPDRAMNRINDRHRAEMVDFITAELGDRDDLVAKCVPDYPAFGKRILLDNGWFKTLRLPHVALVTEPIASIEPGGIRTADGELHPADTIVMATGFNVTDLTARIDIVGRDGATLAEEWADANPRAYLGMTVPKFPNMIVLYGPNTNMGHGGSGIWLAETQTRYVTDLLVDMVETNTATFECPSLLRDAYTANIDELHDELVWAHPRVRTYYRNASGQVRSPMPFRLVDYWTMTRESGLADLDTKPGGVATRSG